MSQHIPLEQGAREHFEMFGRKEHRTVVNKRRTEKLPGADQLYYLFRTIRLDGLRNP